MPRPRLRFSLQTALLLTTIVALAIVVVMQWRDVVPLRAVVHRLRDEVGELSVDDPTKLCAIQVDTRDELTWKWRVWIPKGRVYRLREHGGEVPKEGFPQNGGTVWLRKPGENVVVYRIVRDPRDGTWHGEMKAGSGGAGGNTQPWVERPRRTSTADGVGTSTQSFEPDQRVELMRYRVSQAESSRQIEDPAAGFMIWLEPETGNSAVPTPASSGRNGGQ